MFLLARSTLALQQKGSTNSWIHHCLPECIAFNQSALRYEQHEDVIPSFRMASSEKFCSDNDVKEVVIDFHNSCLCF